MANLEVLLGLPVLGFSTAAEFEGWLAAAPPDAPGIWLKLVKKRAAAIGVSKRDAIDAALCHGWIGQQRTYDDGYWLTRFTPRRRGSKWSQVNRARALELIANNRITPAGLAEIEAARADGRWDAAYAPASTAEPTPELQAALDASPVAAAFFATLKGASRYAILYRIANVKTPLARARRIAEFIAMLERGETIHG